MAVFFYEIQQKPIIAITLAEVSIAQALEKIDDCPEEQFRESKIILEMIKGNIEMWTD